MNSIIPHQNVSFGEETEAVKSFSIQQKLLVKCLNFFFLNQHLILIRESLHHKTLMRIDCFSFCYFSVFSTKSVSSLSLVRCSLNRNVKSHMSLLNHMSNVLPEQHILSLTQLHAHAHTYAYAFDSKPFDLYVQLVPCVQCTRAVFRS